MATVENNNVLAPETQSQDHSHTMATVEEHGKVPAPETQSHIVGRDQAIYNPNIDLPFDDWLDWILFEYVPPIKVIPETQQPIQQVDKASE